MRCLWALVVEAAAEGVTTLVLESRGAHNDVRDRREIELMRRVGVIGPHVRYQHRRGADEPGLWAADALAGWCGDDAVHAPTRVEHPSRSDLSVGGFREVRIAI